MERFAVGKQTMEDFAALDEFSMERGVPINPQINPFQFIFFCATRKLGNVLSIEANKGLQDIQIHFNLFDMNGQNNKGCLLSVCLGQKVYFNETRTGTVETNKAMGVVIGFMGKRETEEDKNKRMKEHAKRKEDIVVPPLWNLRKICLHCQWWTSLKKPLFICCFE